MAHSDDIDRVLRKHRNAIRKASRLENNGIRIRNTDEYPYVKPDEIRSMSPRQLRQHESQLDDFTSRRTQYVKGADNGAIRKSTYEQYVSLQETNNRLAESLESAIGGITLPGSDTTVAGLLALRERLPKNQRMGVQERFFQSINRGLNNFTGEKGVRDAIAELQRRMSPSTLAERVESRLNSIRTALNYSGNHDLIEQIEGLTLAQQIFMIDYSRFESIAANDINSDKYSSSGDLLNAEYEERNGVIEHSETHDNLVATIEWIKQNAKPTAAASRTIGARKRPRKRKSN